MVKKATESKPNQLLRTARKERNWTQKEVADCIGSPQSFNISRWEQGTAFPSTHYIQKLCDLFGRSAKELGLLLEESTTNSGPSAAEKPLPLWNVPYRRNPFFTGREEVLEHLHNRLIASGTAALTHTQAISGLGGIGKTQIAVEYTYRHREAYRFIFWVRAASRDSLISDFVNLASLLQLAEQDEQDQIKVVGIVKRWLAHHGGWLLVLDNADDLNLVADFLPTGDKGHILFTTRTQATGRIAPSITVEKMNRAEGTLLLLRRAKVLALDASLEQVIPYDRNQADAIVAALDGIPLGLDQAGAYIEETGCSLSEYLELYRTHRKELLRRRNPHHTDHPESLAATLRLSFLKLEQTNAAAADVLRLCAFLDPDAIPEEILTLGPPDLGPLLDSIAADPFKLNEAMEALRKFSLVQRDPGTKSLNLHRLVQVVLKDEMDEQAQQLWAKRTVKAVNRAFPEVTFEDWKRCQQYLPHAQACTRLIEQYRLAFPEAARLLTYAGWYLYERALYAQAEPLLQDALAMQEYSLSSEHPDTATTLDHLAFLYRLQGRYAEAEPLFRRALAMRERILGPEHPTTADTLNNLAILYDDLSRYSEAESAYQRALAIYVKAQGPEHTDTAGALNNLAYLYQNQGRYEEAEPLYQRALAICERALGFEHHYTAIALNNLAHLYRLQQRYAEAEPLHQQALAICERVSGPEHPTNAVILNDLAQLYHLQGQYAQAEPLYERALTIREQTMGPEHPRSATVLNDLARLYHEQSRYAEAEPLYRRALTIREQALGPEHPDTLAVRVSYSGLLGEMEQSMEVAKIKSPE